MTPKQTAAYAAFDDAIAAAEEAFTKTTADAQALKETPADPAYVQATVIQRTIYEAALATAHENLDIALAEAVPVEVPK